MVLIGLLCAKGAPGVTTSALAIAAQWPRLAVVVDADPSGGDIAAGLGRGAWPPGCHLLELVACCRTEPLEAALRGLVVRAGDHAPLALAGLGSPAQAAAVRLVALQNQCTGNPAYAGELDTDDLNATDCKTESDRGTIVHAAELQVFSSVAPGAPISSAIASGASAGTGFL